MDQTTRFYRNPPSIRDNTPIPTKCQAGHDVNILLCYAFVRNIDDRRPTTNYTTTTIAHWQPHNVALITKMVSTYIGQGNATNNIKWLKQVLNAYEKNYNVTREATFRLTIDDQANKWFHTSQGGTNEL